MTSRTLPVVVRSESVLLVTLVFVGMLEALTSVMVIVSAPEILNDFGASVGASSGLLTAYFVPFVVFMPIWSKLGDIYGRKVIFLLGLALFLVGSVVALSASSLAVLVLGRAIQGMGTSAHEPLTIATIGDLIALDRRGRAIGFVGTAGSVASFLAIAGGPLISQFGWRVIFAVCTVTGIAALLLARRNFPYFPAKSSVARVDWTGAVSFSLGMVLVILAISNGSTWGWDSGLTLFLLVAGAVSLVLTPRARLRGAEPFLDARVLRNRVFWLCALAAACAVMTLTAVTLTLPIFLREALSLSTTDTSLALAGSGVGLFTGSLLGGFLTDVIGARRTGIGAFVAFTFGMLLLGNLLSASFWLIVLAFGLVGVATAASISPLGTAMTASVATGELSSASGAYNLIRRTGTTLGAAVGGALLDSRLHDHALVVEPSTALLWSQRDTVWLLAIVPVVAIVLTVMIPGRHPHAVRPSI